MYVIYCKELNRYYKDVKTASICTDFTTNYIKSCISGKYKHPFYYHFYKLPYNKSMVLTEYKDVKKMLKVNKELEKITARVKTYSQLEQKKEKFIRCKETDKLYKTYKEAATDTKTNSGYVKLCCLSKIEKPFSFTFEIITK